jgi:hypothetical protein
MVEPTKEQPTKEQPTKEDTHFKKVAKQTLCPNLNKLSGSEQSEIENIG